MNSQQQYCLKWNNHQTNLQRVFARLLRNEIFTDVTLACEGHALQAHKVSVPPVVSGAGPQSTDAASQCRAVTGDGFCAPLPVPTAAAAAARAIVAAGACRQTRRPCGRSHHGWRAAANTDRARPRDCML